MKQLEARPAVATAVRLAASHDALANYLLGTGAGSTTGHANGHAEGARAAADDAAAYAPDANLAQVLANAALSPLARDHPWALVAGSAVAGALLATRPWRAVLRPILVAGMVSPVLTGWAVRALIQSLANRMLGPDPARSDGRAQAR